MTIHLERTRVGIRMDSPEWKPSEPPGEPSNTRVFDWQDRVPNDNEGTSSIILVAFPESADTLVTRLIDHTDDGKEVVIKESSLIRKKITDAHLQRGTGRLFEREQVVYEDEKPLN
jgi:hypothetical protein